MHDFNWKTKKPKPVLKLPEVESGLPMPRVERLRVSEARISLLNSMKTGDSIFVNTKHECGMFYTIAKRIGITIKARGMDGGFRIWRL